MNYQSKNFGPTIQGMLYKLKMIEAITNNVANAGTAGYKRVMPEALSFKSILGEAAIHDQSQGSLNKTGNQFDLAIEGNANFLVEGKNGPEPSRLSNFQLNSKGNLSNILGQELVIVEKTDKEINLAKYDDIRINQNGEIFVGSERYGRIALQILDDKPVRVHQGSVESSNVDLMGEMASLSVMLRSFEASEKALGMEASIDKELIEKYGRNV